MDFKLNENILSYGKTFHGLKYRVFNPSYLCPLYLLHFYGIKQNKNKQTRKKQERLKTSQQKHRLLQKDWLGRSLWIEQTDARTRILVLA